MAGEDKVARGKSDQVKGKVQEGVGKLTGDDELKARGKAKQTGGKVKEGVGKLQDAAKDVVRKKD